jgi:nucleotide-binding universal stress UspA family protein
MPVLVGFVPTPEGRAALRRAIAECHLRRTRLIVVNSEYRSAGVTSDDPSDDEVRSACAELGVSEPEFEVHRLHDAYEPADHVLEVAEQTEADLIVIGLRRRTAVGKLILGGSAQRILLDASCPVLAVKVDQRIPSDEFTFGGESRPQSVTTSESTS